ncbi:MAG: type I polyketide synthase [Limnobacter sp.]|nr:type I polyketide synthase [Limnobacter sp.]
MVTAVYDPKTYAGRIGCFAGAGMSLYAGATLSNYFTCNVLPNLPQFDGIDPAQLIIANKNDYLATRLSYKLNLRGPSLDIQTACSSSLVCVHMACQSILLGECDMAIAGGAAVQIPIKSGYIYNEGSILSPDGYCRAFSSEAKGCVGGSGAGAVLLKKASAALADGDFIHAVIKGSAINNDGSRKVSYSAPSITGQVEVIQRALSLAEVDPSTIGYVEAHGTGTALGDPVEIAALTEAWRNSEHKQYCAIGSVKTNIGHLDTAAGIAGFIKAVLCVREGKIPASLHCENPSPALELHNTPFYIAQNSQEWPETPTASRRRAAVSAFGAGGTNAHLVLEQAPENLKVAAQESPGELLLALSAVSDASLMKAIHQLKNRLPDIPENDLADFTYSHTMSYGSLSKRQAFQFSSLQSLELQLAQALKKGLGKTTQENNRHAFSENKHENTPKNGHPKLAFVFTGHGAEPQDTCLDFYRFHHGFKQAFDRCNAVFQALTGECLLALLSRKSERLKQADYLQPLLFAYGWSLSQLWQAVGIKPDALIGHSLGEYIAACVAGVFEVEDGMRLVHERGRLCATMAQGEMYSVLLQADQVSALIVEYRIEVSIAAINSADSCVVSGKPAALKNLLALLHEKQVEFIRLPVDMAFHSPAVNQIKPGLKTAFSQFKLHAPRLKIMSNLTGCFLDSPAQWASPDYWLEQLSETVLFHKGLERLHTEGYRCFVEIGPKSMFANSLQGQSALVWYRPGRLPGLTASGCKILGTSGKAGKR